MKTLMELDKLYDELPYEEFWSLKDERVEYLKNARANDTITDAEWDELFNYYYADDPDEDDCIDEAERVGMCLTQFGWI